VEAVHVNSRPWSVKDNKQLLKPREMWAKTILQARANIIRILISDYKQVFINISKFTLLF
jgi:hypothetical protein